MKNSFIAFALSATSFSAIALPIPDNSNPRHAVMPASIDCVIDAAKMHDVPANILLAVASQERGKNGQRVKNKNGSYDLGHFQINTIHWESPKGQFRNTSITPNDVLWRGCYAAELAAYMIKQHTLSGKNNYWQAVASYHSATPKFNAAYRDKIVKYAVEWGRWLEANYAKKQAIKITYKHHNEGITYANR